MACSYCGDKACDGSCVDPPEHEEVLAALQKTKQQWEEYQEGYRKWTDSRFRNCELCKLFAPDNSVPLLFKSNCPAYDTDVCQCCLEIEEDRDSLWTKYVSANSLLGDALDKIIDWLAEEIKKYEEHTVKTQ